MFCFRFQVCGAHLPPQYDVHIGFAAVLQFRGGIHRAHQAEGHMPVRRSEDAGVQQAAYRVEGRPPEGPGAPTGHAAGLLPAFATCPP